MINRVQITSTWVVCLCKTIKIHVVLGYIVCVRVTLRLGAAAEENCGPLATEATMSIGLIAVLCDGRLASDVLHMQPPVHQTMLQSDYANRLRQLTDWSRCLFLLCVRTFISQQIEQFHATNGVKSQLTNIWQRTKQSQRFTKKLRILKRLVFFASRQSHARAKKT